MGVRIIYGAKMNKRNKQPYELRLYVPKRPGHFISADMERVDGHWRTVHSNIGIVSRADAMGNTHKRKEYDNSGETTLKMDYESWKSEYSKNSEDAFVSIAQKLENTVFRKQTKMR